MSEVNALTNAGAGFYRMTPIEVATGWLTGESSDAAPTAGMPAPRGPAPGVLGPGVLGPGVLGPGVLGPGVLGPGVLGPGVLGSPAPLEALESLLAPALARPPCVVAFSGGRDSSALLAVATSLAARHGLAKPIAGTLDYAGEQDADEREWQELVVRRLGVADWEKVTVGDGADLLGPVATDGLRRHGLLWPPAHHTILPLLRLASGGSLVTGDGGDEVFGGHRVTPLVRLLHGRLPRSRGEVAEGGLALAPRSVRHRAYFRSLQAQLARSWLRPGAAGDLRRRGSRRQSRRTNWLEDESPSLTPHAGVGTWFSQSGPLSRRNRYPHSPAASRRALPRGALPLFAAVGLRWS